MRLKPGEIDAIRESFYEVFGSGRIYLFGSRLDDQARGGDINLYLTPNCLKKEERARLLARFLLRLCERIGEQKIECFFAENPQRPIEREALQSGVAL